MSTKDPGLPILNETQIEKTTKIIEIPYANSSVDDKFKCIGLDTFEFRF